MPERESVLRWRRACRWLSWPYFLVLVTLTHIPVPEILEEWVSLRDKLLHALTYGTLAFLWAYGYGGAARSRRWILVASVLWAAVDEITQGLVGRFPDVLDWVADSLGMAIGVTLAGQLLSGKIIRSSPTPEGTPVSQESPSPASPPPRAANQEAV